MTSSRIQRAAPALLAVATFALAACGGDDSSGDDASANAKRPAATQTPAAAEREVSGPVDVTGGVTSLRLDSATMRVLDLAGVRLSPTGRARERGDAFRFPITGGTLDVDAPSGRIEHAGGLRLEAAGRSIDITNLIVRPGRRLLMADVAGRQVPLLSLDTGKLRKIPVTHTILIPATAGTLTLQAVPALNDRLGIDAFRDGLRLGRVEVSAKS